MLKKKLLALFVSAMMVLSLAGCTTPQNAQAKTQTQAVQVNQKTQVAQAKPVQTQSKPVTKPAAKPAATPATTGKLVISFIDVGQGDSILVQAPSGKTMLVDAGVPEMGSRVVSYIRSRNVKKIDVLVATHPHNDHIGGMPDVINSLGIGSVYMPKASTNTYSFEKLLTTIKHKGLTVKTAKAGVVLDLGSGITAKMLAPNSTYYDDLNNYSAVIKITYGKTSFLLTGDAEVQSEQEMLKAGYDLKADVLKIGHHGSAYSTSLAFLNAVKPKYAVISVGKNNDYGHPAQVTMNRLKYYKIPVYRTDENGTIVATSDSKTITFNVKPGDYTPGNKSGSTNTSSSKPSTSTVQSLPYGYYGEPGKVYVDSSGRGLIKGNINSKGEKIYHIPGDPWYDRTKAERWFKTEAEAQAAGFRPPKK
ncbi:Metal-dependent hydrolase, beta-lactamase superfamily II [Caldanaerobius fijiensis DSM 17918]|uniref:Metal-dependent hydrolase, beta-lactamase superfamily II n=1 Tax=Caldanaerobius fijiensis DSM 17918 TaxID=1121256 RepID=A0A1M5FQB2_9THEO|nr:ComEC/Rec2 family competence protein [Caldanaerobius fijiensis]SHF93740.1 Metal-dependent hydrolase, beta-lactamase superfamily II [Caldanaerobius fijiensis DSM 17918]